MSCCSDLEAPSSCFVTQAWSKGWNSLVVWRVNKCHSAGCFSSTGCMRQGFDAEGSEAETEREREFEERRVGGRDG